jgi:hypothetical protein
VPAAVGAREGEGDDEGEKAVDDGGALDQPAVPEADPE